MAGRGRAGVRVGSVRGIEIRAQWSLLIVFVLLASSLATGFIPSFVDGVSAIGAWGGGIVGAVCFLASLLAHELSHSLVARRKGVGVRSITLWILGGIAHLEGDAPDAHAELRIALAGPLMSLALAAGFGASAVALDSLDSLDGASGATGATAIAVAVTGWLAMVNAMLAIFNLLPGAPLDGGRVLRAWLWRRSGDRLGSQRRAARAGRGLAYLLIGLGVVEFAFGGGFPGLWLALIGWFVLSAASAEELDAILRAELGSITVRDVMSRDPVTVPSTIAVQQLIDGLVLQHRSAYPVVDAGVLVGLVTLSHVRRLPPERRAATTVAAIMTPRDECRLVSPDDKIVDVLAAAGGPMRLLVVDDDRLVGIVTPTDVARLVETTRVVAMR